MSFCHEGFLVSATMQLPEVKLKVTAQQCGAAEQPRLQEITTTTSPPTRKRKKLEYSRLLLQWWDAHFQRSSKNCRQKSIQDSRHGAMKPPAQGKSSTKGEFQSDLVGNDLLKVGNFHLHNVFIFSLFTPLPSRGGFPGIQWSEAPWMCQARLLWRSLADEPAYCSWWAQGARDKPQWLQKSTHMHISVKPFSRKMSRTNKNLPHNTRIARWNKNPCSSKSSDGGKTIAGFVWY